MEGVLSLILTTLCTYAFGATLIVPDDHATIQAAIDAASEGDTIVVEAGTFTENIYIETNNLTLVGAGIKKTIISPYLIFKFKTFIII